MNSYAITPLDIIFCLPWLVLFSMFTVVVYIKNREKPGYQYFATHFIWKTFVGLGFAVVYTSLYGGDTTAYFQGAVALKNLALENPDAFFHEIFSRPDSNIPSYYNAQTGYPPIWIYREANSWFICKITCLPAFFSFNSFFCMSLFCSYISSSVTWRFYRFLVDNLVISERNLAIAFLFVPTTSFWCSGLSKDTFVFCFLLLLIKAIFEQIVLNKIVIRKIIWIVILSYLILVTRSFVLLAVYTPFFLFFIFKWNRKASAFTKLVTRVFGIGIAVLFITIYMFNSDAMGEFSTEKIVQTAETTYNDFQNNETYGAKAYDLGISEFTTSSIIRAAPLAVITAVFRPFLWEADGILMYLNGLESLIMLYFTAKIIRLRRAGEKKVQDETTKNFIFISLIFCFIMAFFVGFTSALFGVLVRMKAPILPFFLVCVFNRLTNDNSKKDEKIYSE